MARPAARRLEAGNAPSTAAVGAHLERSYRSGDLLDCLGDIGLVIRPYFVNLETAPHQGAPPLPEQCSVRQLTVTDIEEIVRITLRPPNPTDLASNLERYYCLGLFYEGELAAYTWASTRGLPVPDSGGAKLCDLTAAEAYLFDMYVIPRHRGTRLAGTLAQSMHAQMTHIGRNQYYSRHHRIQSFGAPIQGTVGCARNGVAAISASAVG